MTDETTAEGGTYVLQVDLAINMSLDGRDVGDGGYSAWIDVATVTVPARTKRKTAIRSALKQAGLDVTEETKVRLLDAESAEVRTVRPRPPAAPELEIV